MRFLQQATFGATPTDLDRVMAVGYNAWLDEQLAMPVQYSHVATVTRRAATFTGDYKNRPGVLDVNASMWLGMAPSSDQLRQRTMFALSQIFVVSLRDGSTEYQATGLAGYVDMLYAKGFGNFRTLLESVALSTAMGSFLSHIYNRKEDPVTGSNPDQNFARESMQLFTIGLWELNADGTRRLDTNGKPIPTYTSADVVGVSRVMTGWAYEGATDQHWNQYYGFWSAADMLKQARPMVANPKYHSVSEKKFLGVTIPASTTPDPAGDLKVLLDRLFNHANTGPFIGKQLIQRFVTSNPSKAYVSRVSAVFANNGSGTRGDMKAVIKAILLDPEARNASSITWNQFGRLREPIGRLAQLMRVFKAKTDAEPDDFGIGIWRYDKNKGLWQTPLGAPSVFNFYYPDYMPPTSALSRAGLVAPEMQITTQSSVSDMAFYFRLWLQNAGVTDCCSDVQRSTWFMKFDYSEWLPLVATPAALCDRLSIFFMAGQMSAELKNAMIAEMNSANDGHANTSGIDRGVTQIKFAEAVYTMLCAAEYVVQK